MTIKELLDKINDLPNKDRLPHYIEIEDISDSQVLMDGEWGNEVQRSDNMIIKASTFFPDSLSPQEVIDDINEAFANKTDVKNLDGTYSGICKRGYAIKMYMNGDKIASAFPVYKSDNIGSEV